MPGQPIELNREHFRRRALHPEAYTKKALRRDSSALYFMGTPLEIARSLAVRGQALEAVLGNQVKLVEDPDPICKTCLNPRCLFNSVPKQNLREKLFQVVTAHPKFPDIERGRRQGSEEAFEKFVNFIDKHWEIISSRRSGIVPSTTNR